MANDPRTIGEKIRAAEERALGHVPENKPGNKEPAEGSRETVTADVEKPRRSEPRRPEHPQPRGGTEPGQA